MYKQKPQLYNKNPIPNASNTNNLRDSAVSLRLLQPSTSTETPSNLLGNVDLDVKLLSPGPNQSRVLGEVTSAHDNIRALSIKQVLSLLSGGDGSDSRDESGLSLESGLDSAGEVGLVTGAGLDLLVRRLARGRDIDEIDSTVGKDLGQLHSLLKSP